MPRRSELRRVGPGRRADIEKVYGKEAKPNYGKQNGK